MPVLELELSDDFAPLTVQMQDGRPVVWVRTNLGGPKRKVTFRIVGTGKEVNPFWTYVGTFQDGPFVWHLFHDVPVGGP